ncbi:hypothetical protein J7L48_04525 [bacterium]|nr:hypothetical protein [bacterium]
MPITQMIFWKRCKLLLFLFIMLFSISLFTAGIDYIAGGSPIPLYSSGADNFNPAFGIFQNNNFYTINTLFSGKAGIYNKISLAVKSNTYSFKITFNSNFYDDKTLNLQFSSLIARNLSVGIAMKAFLQGQNVLTFNGGIVWDKKHYIMSIAYFNFGGLETFPDFPKYYGNDFLKNIANPELFFLNENNGYLREGVISNFIFTSNEKWYLSITINQFVDSFDNLLKLGWENVYWGALYRLSDGSYLGFGTNKYFNSAGVGFSKKVLFASYAFLWQTKKFTKHIVTAGVIF